MKRSIPIIKIITLEELHTGKIVTISWRKEKEHNKLHYSWERINNLDKDYIPVKIFVTIIQRKSTMTSINPVIEN